MLPLQCKPACNARVIECRATPRRVAVTTDAIRREVAARMLSVIIGPVTRNTVVAAGWHRVDERVIGGCVTRRAWQCGMRTAQREALVLEDRIIPALHVVARHTNVRETGTGVLPLVIGIMTRRTLLRSGWLGIEFEAAVRRQMAGAARRPDVGAQ